MSFRGDRRGVTVQVGAVLLLGILVLLLATYQTTVVPQQNERVEFQHSEAVQDDILDLRGAILETADREGFRAVTVQMGTQYPERALFVNPPPASGTLQTSDAGEMGVHNASATNPETRDYLNGSRTVSTTHLSYTPSYSIYQNAPRTTYQSGVVVNSFENSQSIALSEQPIVRGNEVTLVAIDGSLSQAQVRALEVEPRSLSTIRESTTVRGTGDGLNVTVPTTLSESAWESLLADELDPAGDPNNARYVTNITKTGNVVRIQLEANRTYRLRTALVGVGQGGETPQPAYVTNVTETNTSLARGTPLVVEVRDRYNNPVDPTTYPDNVMINVTEGRDLVDPDRTTVDSDGRARVRYTGGEGQVTLKVERLNGPESEVTFNVTERSAQGGGGGGGGSDNTPLIRLRVDDLSNKNSPQRFVVSYDTQNTNSSFEEIRIQAEGTGSISWYNQEETLQDRRGSVNFSLNGGYNGEIKITARLYYSDNQGAYIEDSQTVTDTADGQNSPRNQDLSEENSPTLNPLTEIRDVSKNNNRVRYEFDYTVNTNNNFQSVTLAAIKLNGNGKTAIRNGISVTNGIEYIPKNDDNGKANYMNGVGSQYRVVILVYDSDGVVVDAQSWEDTADGSGSDNPS